MKKEEGVLTNDVSENPGHIVIVGAGVAGVNAAQAARKTSPSSRITLISKERHLPYYRINLTRYIAGEIRADGLNLHPPEWYRSNGITLLLGKEMCSIDQSNKQLRLRGGEKLEYDRLIVTTGAHCFVPPIPGVHRENVVSFRTKDDADYIVEKCKSSENVIVIGGGTLGLEAAGAIAQSTSCTVTVIESCRWLIPRQLNETAAHFLQRYITSLGINLIIDKQIKKIAGDECVRGVQLTDGTTVPADLVIIATGICSNTYLPATAGLAVSNGVVVDDYLRSSQKDIFAAGDVVEHEGIRYGLWVPAQQQGKVAGANAAGGETLFTNYPPSNMLKVLGYTMLSIGCIDDGNGTLQKIEKQAGDDRYYYLVFNHKRIVGAILMGKNPYSSHVKRTVEKEVDCSEILEKTTDAEEILEFLKGQGRE